MGNDAAFALAFFGKHAGHAVRSQAMRPGDLASKPMFDDAARGWNDAVVSPFRAHVFMHSWSPEVAPWATRAYASALQHQIHEPTLFVSASATRLRGVCPANLINCQRTMSQLISVRRVVQLMLDYETLHACEYMRVLLTRHDLRLYRTPYPLPTIRSSTELHFGRNADHERCAGTRSASRCIDASRACCLAPRDWTMQDFLVYGSSSAIAKLAGAADEFHRLTHMWRRATPYVCTHWIWPLFALHHNASLRYDMGYYGSHYSLLRQNRSQVPLCTQHASTRHTAASTRAVDAGPPPHAGLLAEHVALHRALCDTRHP